MYSVNDLLYITCRKQLISLPFIISSQNHNNLFRFITYLRRRVLDNDYFSVLYITIINKLYIQIYVYTISIV